MRAVWIMAVQGSKVREEWREWGLSVHLMIEDAQEVTHQSSYSTTFWSRLPLCLPSISLCFHYDCPLWICCSFLFCLSVATLPFSQPFIRPRKQEQTLLKFFWAMMKNELKSRPSNANTCCFITSVKSFDYRSKSQHDDRKEVIVISNVEAYRNFIS